METRRPAVLLACERNSASFLHPQHALASSSASSNGSLQVQDAFSVQMTNLFLVLFAELQMAQPIGSDVPCWSGSAWKFLELRLVVGDVIPRRF